MSMKRSLFAILLFSALGIVPLVTLAQTDMTAPTSPTNLRASAVSSSAILLTWNASTDASGVQGYKIYRATAPSTTTVQVATSTTLSFQNSGLAPATNYIYSVAAYDTAGNTSAKSTPASTAIAVAAKPCAKVCKCVNDKN